MSREYDELMKISDEECTCTDRQLTGDDPTVCRSCTAGHALDEMCEIASDRLSEIMKCRGGITE